MDDRAVVEAQLQRPLRSDAGVAHRCPLGLPVVVVVPPVLDDGTPFPTRYWLTCPLANRRVGRVEAAGGVRSIQRYAESDAGFAERLADAHRRYAAERDAAVPESASLRPSGGVAGSEVGAGVKCLHAHYADTAAGNENPVGDAVMPFVDPLDCTVPCVAEVDGQTVRNPSWVEPR
jgi:hypothetical protein